MAKSPVLPVRLKSLRCPSVNNDQQCDRMKLHKGLHQIIDPVTREIIKEW